MIRQTQTFIGSSSEGLAVANAIKANLSEHTDCRIWTEGVFLPGRTFIETLEKILDEMDYAILLATPDDSLTKRDVENFSMRDNVLLELGLFMAKLGRRRTYLVSPKDRPIHIPSDLLGLTTVAYEYSRDARDWTQTLAEPCETIRMAMREAEKELSLAMKRDLVKRLLGWTTKLQGFIVTIQTESIKSVLDRSKFERLRQDIAGRISETVHEHKPDADSLNVGAQYDHLVAIMLGAVETIPFPEEAVVSKQEVVDGVLGHLLGRRSIESQLNERVASLVSRYEVWWTEQGPRISKALLDLQASLIGAM